MKRKNIPYIFLIMLVIAFLFSSISFAQSVRNPYNYNFLLSPFIIDPLYNYYGFLNHSPYNTSRSGYENIANTSSLSNTWPLFSALSFYSPIITYNDLSLNTGLSDLWHLFSPISYNLSTTSSSSSNGLPDDSQTVSGLSEKQSEFVSVGTSTQNTGSGGSTGYGGVYGGSYAGGYGGGYGGVYGGSYAGGYGYAAYGAAPTDATPETPEETEEDLEREIEEADIIKIDGTDLYILNQYRGLVICDISQPESPSITGRVVITGTPEEMYIRDGRAYIIVNKSTATSMVIVVDVTITSQPHIIGSFDLNGEVTDSRIVGHILYVVSSETIFECESDYEGYQTCYPSESEIQRNIYIASINVSDPENIHQMYRVDFEGTAHHIHVSEEAIFIASTPENTSADTSTISYIDISNIDGSMIMRGSIELPGIVKDEFKMDYYNSYFRVCTYEEIENEGWGVSNLYVIDTSDPDILQQVGSVVLGLGEQLFATRFDEERAYMVTFRRIDPLWVIDLSDPTNPRITAELEVTGWSTHIETSGDRLIALGVDDTGGQKVCVSLFNVADPENPFLIKRVSFSGSEGSSYGWSTSVAYDDIHAFTIQEELGMILLPYFTKYYDEEDQRHTDNRLQIIDYTPDDLTARGWVSQKGSVLRSRSFSDYLFSISVEELQVIDASIRDEPQVVSSLTLARNIIDFIPLTNGYGVQVIYEDDRAYTLRAVPLTSPEDGDAASELELSYENDPFIIGNNNMVYVIERNSNPTKLQIYDFNEISNPCSRGSLDISGSYANLRSLLGGKAITYSDYSSNEIVQIRDDVLAFYRTNSYYYPSYYGTYPYSGYYQSWPSSNNCEIIVVHLSDPDNPRTSSSIPINAATPRGLFSKNEILYFSYNINTIEDDLARPQSKYYLGRIDLSDPDNPIELNPVNIPGFCMGLSNSGEYAYTINDEWVQNRVYYYSKAYSFNVVRIIDDQAYLYDKVDLAHRSANAVISDGFAYLSESGYYGYGYYGGYYGGGYYGSSPYGGGDYGSSPGWVIINLADPENLVKYEHTFGGNIFAARSGKAFVSMSNEVSCFNVTDPEHPQPEELRSGNNKYDQITFFNNAAYLPLGYYGLWVKSL